MCCAFFQRLLEAWSPIIHGNNLPYTHPFLAFSPSLFHSPTSFSVLLGSSLNSYLSICFWQNPTEDNREALEEVTHAHSGMRWVLP